MPKRADGEPNKKRQMSMKGALKQRYKDRQIPWAELWMNMAHMVAVRARCSRDRVGAVIVDADNKMISVGYNGPPAGMPVYGWCIDWCPRAIAAAAGKPVNPGYADCHSLHAEANAIMRAESRPFAPGTTLYVSSSVCSECAKLVAGSGITRVVVDVVPSEVRHRNPDDVIAFLMECGVDVVVYTRRYTAHRYVFDENYGPGPHPCYFCDLIMPWPEVVHHIDHDHSNNDPANLVPAHAACHTSYHIAAVGGGGEASADLPKNPKSMGPWMRRKPHLACTTCGMRTTPGWLKKHCEKTGHDSASYDEWREKETARLAAIDPRPRGFAAKRKCNECGMVTGAGAMSQHQKHSNHVGISIP